MKRSLGQTVLGCGTLPLKFEHGHLLLVDQRQLPHKFVYFDATEFDEICLAIKDMIVRGAPSIGVAAAFGFALEANRQSKLNSRGELKHFLEVTKEKLDQLRPTAVNLRWSTDRMLSAALNLLSSKVSTEDFCSQTLATAQAILDEHLAVNLKISNFGCTLLSANAAILTHCNAGPLAVCGWGTALGVVRVAYLNGLNPHVYVDETRPRNQGARLTMWELHQDQIPATLICDSMSGYLMKKSKIDMVITGADRIARNGDSANKIGTYNLAIVAKHHGVPFYIAAPLSTFDATTASGAEIPIEERHPSEVLEQEGAMTTEAGASALNPAFDVTPADLITGIITEAGILRPPYAQAISQALSNQHNDQHSI